MRLVYMDETGISHGRDEPFAIVAGIIVDPDRKLTAIERHLECILERHIPAQLCDGFVFHAKEIFNGGGKVFKREKPDMVGPVEWPLERRLAIADDLADIPRRFDLPIALGWVKREGLLEEFEFPDLMNPLIFTGLEKA
jgi:hypothetical protein